MKLIVCVDKNNGMMFNNRRVSKDSIVRNKILEIVENNKLFMNEYSAKQFENLDRICVNDDFLNIIKEDDFCFIENTYVDIDKVNIIYMFNWNRIYPADFYFNFDVSKFDLIDYKKFKGSSHEEISLEVFKRR